MRKKTPSDDIYNAALKIFAEFGYKKSTMEDIAKELDMTKCNLYLYAENKMDLYQNTVRTALTKWQIFVMEAVLTEKTSANQFFALGKKAINYLDENHELRALLKRDPDIFPMFPSNEPYETIHTDSIKILQAIIENGIVEKIFRPVNVENISRILFSIYKMFIIRIYVQDPADKATVKLLFNEALDLVTRGLFAVPPSNGDSPIKLKSSA
jgi:AcrR family transcriptional regulator